MKSRSLLMRGPERRSGPDYQRRLASFIRGRCGRHVSSQLLTERRNERRRPGAVRQWHPFTMLAGMIRQQWRHERQARAVPAVSTRERWTAWKWMR